MYEITDQRIAKGKPISRLVTQLLRDGWTYQAEHIWVGWGDVPTRLAKVLAECVGMFPNLLIYCFNVYLQSPLLWGSISTFSTHGSSLSYAQTLIKVLCPLQTFCSSCAAGVGMEKEAKFALWKLIPFVLLIHYTLLDWLDSLFDTKHMDMYVCVHSRFNTQCHIHAASVSLNKQGWP